MLNSNKVVSIFELSKDESKNKSTGTFGSCTDSEPVRFSLSSITSFVPET